MSKVLYSIFFLLASAGLAFAGMGLIYLLTPPYTVADQSSAPLFAIAYFFLTTLCWGLAAVCLGVDSR